MRVLPTVRSRCVGLGDGAVKLALALPERVLVAVRRLAKDTCPTRRNERCVKRVNTLPHLPVVLDVVPHVVQELGAGHRVPGQQAGEAVVAVVEQADMTS